MASTSSSPVEQVKMVLVITVAEDMEGCNTYAVKLQGPVKKLFGKHRRFVHYNSLEWDINDTPGEMQDALEHVYDEANMISLGKLAETGELQFTAVFKITYAPV